MIMMKTTRLLIFSLTILGLLLAGSPTQAQSAPPQALVLTVEGPLTPTWIEYLTRGIQTAEQNDTALIVLQLNTPGGSISILQEIVEIIRGSAIPIVVYVTPRGAMAASAGTVITLAGHAAAMAPETIIGAASPVGGQGEELGETIAAKEKNALKAQVRSLAENRPPAAIALAEATIESAAAVSAQEALQIGLIDFIATDLTDLLNQLDGFTITTAAGERITLQTQNAAIQPLRTSFIEQLLGLLTNPNIVFILLSIGVQAILIELSNPGGWVAGFIGVVSLALATYGLGFLPVNWFGLIFVGTAFVLFVLDLKTPTYGALTATGVGALIVGALVLFNSPATPQFQRVSIPLVVLMALLTGGIFGLAIMFAIKAQQTPIKTGQESLVGKIGVVKQAIPAFGAGQVQLASELWSAELAEGEQPIPKNTKVEVVALQGLRLKVRAL